MNKLTQFLGRICREKPLEEKWLLAPSLRVGYQWLETVTRGGQAAVNVRIKTLKGMTLDLAGPEVTRQGLKLISDQAGELLIDRIWARRRKKSRGYLSSLEVTPGLVQMLYSAVSDLRLAGIRSGELRITNFEVDDKGRELKAILKDFENELKSGHRIDYTGALRMAARRLHDDPAALPGDALVLIPADMVDCTVLEQALLEAIPEQKKRIIPVDLPEDRQTPDKGEKFPDIKLLRWIDTPADAPAPAGDGTAAIFRAVGEANEVREVLRRILAGGLSLDEVELLHTDAGMYIPLIYETAARLQSDDPALKESLKNGLPVTFAEGIPTNYSRPGRSLAAWLQWINDGFSQSTMVRMIQDGLLKITGMDPERVSYTQLAGYLRSLGIFLNRPRHLEKLDEEIASLEQQVQEETPGRDENGKNDSGRATPAKKRLEGITILRNLVDQLLEISPDPEDGPAEILESALRFVTEYARAVGELDNLALMRLKSNIEELLSLVEDLIDEDDDIGLDAWEWLSGLANSSRVGGNGPRPGHLHVASIHSGGHSGRRHTFIVGLEDGRFPGAGLQDPLLLDDERKNLSPDLMTASSRLRESLDDFVRLLARLRGTLTLSFSCRNLVDDRDMFPSSAVVACYRILSGDREGDQGDLMRWLQAPASFAPESPEQCLDETEWWLWRMCGTETIRNPTALLTRKFPHLGRGRRAVKQKDGDRFTAYDGFVPQAGTDMDPASPSGQAMSSNRLEQIGRCPLAYFFKYVLRISPLEEVGIDPSQWLSPSDAGSLLHQVFRSFMGELIEKKELPVFRRDRKRLFAILEEQIQEYREQIPPPGEAVFHRQCRQLRRVASIFLREEESFCKNSRPKYLEASIGLPPVGGGTALDTPEPVRVNLPRRRRIRICGRIDRVDLTGEGSAPMFSIWDYKTGSTYGYSLTEPFQHGRRIQHALYIAMCDIRLKEVGPPGASVDQFGYFFPGIRNRGERFEWTAKQLSEGKAIIDRLCQIVSKGSFLATDKQEDCTYCDYTTICGDIEATVSASKRKLAGPDNTELAAFRTLRCPES